MEELIRHAFRHVEVIGPQVDEGHYDLIGPEGVIMPQFWEQSIRPDWLVTMRMWSTIEAPAPSLDPPLPEALPQHLPSLPPVAPRKKDRTKLNQYLHPIPLPPVPGIDYTIPHASSPSPPPLISERTPSSSQILFPWRPPGEPSVDDSVSDI